MPTLLHVATTAELLQRYVDAEAKILAGQSVRFGDRQLAYPDLAEVRRERTRLQALLLTEQAGGRSRFSQADFSRGGQGGSGYAEGSEWNRW